MQDHVDACRHLSRPELGLDVDRAVPVLGYFPVRRL